MIFIDTNGKKLYAYIASVFGGITEDLTKTEDIYKSVKYSNSECALSFEVNSNTDIISKINVTDITPSFFKQTEYIEKVWGNCKKLDQQGEVNEALKSLYPNLYPGTMRPNVDATKSSYLQLKEKDRSSHMCIVAKGDCNIVQNNTSSAKYLLTSPKVDAGKCSDGLEAMNWIKLEIDLTKNILKTPVQFTIKLDENRFVTPDFTWYFAPPLGYIISEESYVSIGEKKERNAFQSVSDETTVYFSEWSSPPESIAERKKSRIIFTSGSNDNIEELFKEKPITVSLYLANPKGPSNKQFFYGLFIAFLLSFCSDKTRINDFYTCLKLKCTCSANLCNCQAICNGITIFAPILLLLCFISLILTPKEVLLRPMNKKIKHSNKFHAIARLIGLITTIALIIYVFFLWLLFPDFMGGLISCSLNKRILVIGAILSLLFNGVYLFHCLKRLKRKISNYI